MGPEGRRGHSRGRRMARSSSREVLAVLKSDAGPKSDVVFLLDVENTLLDNDRFAADLGGHVESCFGAAQRARYWEIFGRRREALGLADYLGALQEFRSGLDDHPQLLEMSDFLLEYPFASRLFPRAPEAIAHLRTFGLPVVLSDGASCFNRGKSSAQAFGTPCKAVS